MTKSSRASAGESSIHRDEAGRWHGYVSMGLGDNGRRARRHVSSAKRAEVVRKVRELERQRDAGTALTAGRPPTVEAWFTHWVTTIVAANRETSTVASYTSKLRRVTPIIGHHRLDRLLPEHLEGMYARLAAEGLAPGSVLMIHRILSRGLKVAVQRGRIARNPATLIDSPSAERTEVEPLTADDARRLLAAAAEQRNAARWSVALSLGLRQGEALGLQWRDVDLERGTLRVRQALQRRTWKHGCGIVAEDVWPCGKKRGADCPDRHGGGLVAKSPKSTAGRRTLTLPPPLIEALKAHRAEQAQERLLAGELWEDGEFVFAQENGRPIDPARDWSNWKRLLAAAGVRDARLHDARHTAATLLLQLGVPARVAMGILGHSQISLTLGTYSHVVPELATEAAERMGAALWGAPSSGPLAPSEPAGNQAGTVTKLRRDAR